MRLTELWGEETGVGRGGEEGGRNKQAICAHPQVGIQIHGETLRGKRRSLMFIDHIYTLGGTERPTHTPLLSCLMLGKEKRKEK